MIFILPRSLFKQVCSCACIRAEEAEAQRAHKEEGAAPAPTSKFMAFPCHLPYPEESRGPAAPISGRTLLPQVQRWIMGLISLAVHLGFFLPQQPCGQGCRKAVAWENRVSGRVSGEPGRGLPFSPFFLSGTLQRSLLVFLAGRLFSRARP